METLKQLIIGLILCMLAAWAYLYKRDAREPSSNRQEPSVNEQQRSVYKDTSEQQQLVSAQGQSLYEQEQSVCVQKQSVYAQHTDNKQERSLNKQEHSVCVLQHSVCEQEQSANVLKQSVSTQQQSIHEQVHSLCVQEQSSEQQEQPVNVQEQSVNVQDSWQSLSELEQAVLVLERSLKVQEQSVCAQGQSVTVQEQPADEQQQSVSVHEQPVCVQERSVQGLFYAHGQPVFVLGQPGNEEQQPVCEQEQSCLLQLPEHLLVAVLQRCAYKPRTLFSAARAHSSLRQAAAVAASSIFSLGHQQHASSVVAYLFKHGQHVQDLQFIGMLGGVAILQQLPHNLSRLSTLQLSCARLQLAAGNGYRGVLRVGTPLKKLRLHLCTLLDGGQGLAAALRLLPTLQHFSCRAKMPDDVKFHSSVLQQLPHLTHLELAGMSWAGLQPSLSKATLMQHIQLENCSIPYGSIGCAKLVSQLQQLTQLTHLTLKGTLQITSSSAPTAACAALTASSKLQHLDIRECTLPADVWEQVFPYGRYLPDLRVLDIGQVNLHPYTPAALDGWGLISCCPGLQTLRMQGSQYSAGLLLSLKDLSRLQQLSLWPHRPGQPGAAQGLEAVAQLTGLQQLNLRVDKGADDLLLQLTKLQKLTSLEYRGSVDRVVSTRSYKLEGPEGEPVWRQIARDYLNHSLLAVAMRAQMALEESDSPRDTAGDQHFRS